MKILIKKEKSINSGEITLQRSMDHMQIGFVSLRKQIGGLEKRTESIEIRFNSFEKKVDRGFADLLDRWRWLESHDLPKRVSILEDKVFAGIDP